MRIINTLEHFQKQSLRTLLLVLSVFSVSLSFAHDFEVDGIYYNENGSDAIVTYRGSDCYSYHDEYTGSIVIPSNVTYKGKTYKVRSIGEFAFALCTSISNVTIPNSVTTIGRGAFEGSNISSIIVPNSVVSIGDIAFKWCENLTSITIPSSVSFIGIGAFAGCNSMSNIFVENENNKYDSRGACNAIIETETNKLIAGCLNTLIPNTVTTIGERAFSDCYSLTNIDIPNSVTSIDKSAFYQCTGLTSVTIPNSVTTIGNSAFWNCHDLASITIGNSVNTIGDLAFKDCAALETLNFNAVSCSDFSLYSSPFDGLNFTTINIGDEVQKIPAYFAFNCQNLTSINIPSLVTTIGNYAFTNCYSLTSLTIPNSVTSIGNSAFWNCHDLTSITIGNSVNTIGSEAFQECTALETLNFNAISCSDFSSSSPFGGLNLTTINIGDEVQKIPAFFVSGLMTLKTVTIGNALTSIGSSAFYNCSGLSSISLPSSLKTIKSKAFYNCNGLESVYCSAGIPPVMESKDCFTSYSTSTLYVPYQSLETYKTTDYWNEFFKAYGIDGNGHVLADGISLNVMSKNLYENETFILIATITPDGVTSKKVNWSSSNNSIATVNENGLVTAISPGDAVITATTTDGSNLSASCYVTVIQLATSISLKETDAIIYTGNSLQLAATVLPSTTSNPSVTWSSSNTNVATVSSSGLVTAKSTGNAVITANTSDGSNLSASCNVTVKQLATAISLNRTSATLYLDQTLQLTATVLPNSATDKSVVWSSSDNSIAVVTSTGLVTAIAPGNATITATTDDGSNLSASCEITVKAYVTSLTLDPPETTILEGDTIILSPIILPNYATNQSLNWSSNNTNIATVSNGVVVGRSGGEATISASTSDGSCLSASCKVTVIPDFDISAPNFSHIRGSSDNIFDLTINLANRYDITGMQFDIQFPDGVTIAKDNNGEYDISLENSRKSRNHTATASLIGYNSYRILVSSTTANILKGHSGTVLHIMIEIPISHVSGNKQIKYSNIILSEPDETRHTLPTKYSMISYYYKEGDANADVSVDVADYVITGNYILQNSPEDFWYDAANVDHNSTIDVNDLTGITNIALGRREGGILQSPAIQQTTDEDIELNAKPLAIQAGQTKTFDLCLNGYFTFAGFQMDMQLPRGIKLIDASLADQSSGLSIATAELSNGGIRMLASSFSLKNLVVNNATFLRVTLMADNCFNGNDFIMLDNIKFSGRDMTLHTLDNVAIPVGNEVCGLNQLYSEIRIYTDGTNIIIDSPESGSARIITIGGISQNREILLGHNVIPMENAGFYIVTFNGKTAKLRLK